MTGEDDNGNNTGRDIAQYPHLLVAYPFIMLAPWSSIPRIALKLLRVTFLKQTSGRLFS